MSDDQNPDPLDAKRRFKISKSFTVQRTATSYAYNNAERLPGGRPGYEAKAPDHWAAFDKARQDKNNPVFQQWEKHNRENIERHNRIHKVPVTKRELEGLKRLRAKPPQPDLKYGRIVTQERVQIKISVERERRIHFIERRITRMEGRAHEAFNRSR